MHPLHPTLDELSRIGYGFESSPDHVGFCVECLETLRRLRRERDQLRQKPSAPGRRDFFGRLFRRILSAGSRPSSTD
jgi:hypothetical protein